MADNEEIITESSAPGKIILFGEHSVVYGRPAIAAPVTQVRTKATVKNRQKPGVRLLAPDIDQDIFLSDADPQDPFARAVMIFMERSGLNPLPPLTITVTSTIPMASGLGSGAAMAASVIKALALHFENEELARRDQVSELTYIVEKLLHGTPSGIDNTVIAYEQPVFFMRGQPENQIERLTLGRPLDFIIADSGISASTKAVVGDVRRQWLQDRERFERLFDGCGRIAVAARNAIEEGDSLHLGRLMSANQSLLIDMTVSSEALDRLVDAALQAGALGAKLSGAGRGGNIIALVSPDKEEVVSEALIAAGAANTFSSSIGWVLDED